MRRRGRRPLHRDGHVVAHQVDHGVDVDAAGHVADEINERRDTQEREQDAHAQRKVRHELAFALRPDAAQDHERIGKGAQEGAEGELVSAVAHEVAQQPRPHLARGQRKRGDRDREHRAGQPDGRRGDRAQQGAGARTAAVVEPRAFEQRRRQRAAAVDGDQGEGGGDAAQRHESGNEPERLAEVIQEFAEARGHGGRCSLDRRTWGVPGRLGTKAPL